MISPGPDADAESTANSGTWVPGLSTSGRWLVRVALTDVSDSSTLLRLVTVLHTRCSGVEDLVFDAARSSMDATVTLRLGGPARLRQMLLRSVDVTGVAVRPAR
ncbi:hypothetical protein [Nocardia jinanensis]|uniref:hypothetical protein n=1 Tax=Nocardia jinanensis TaxID=382504 RepID=UPI0016669426|nr:hypothetical protein [Nocardia jinanensis]